MTHWLTNMQFNRVVQSSSPIQTWLRLLFFLSQSSAIKTDQSKDLLRLRNKFWSNDHSSFIDPQLD